jgi:hypothetical protein
MNSAPFPAATLVISASPHIVAFRPILIVQFTFISKSFGSSKLLLQCFVKTIVLKELLECLYFGFFRRLELVKILELFSHKVSFLLAEHMHTLETNLSTIHLLEVLDEFAELPLLGDFGCNTCRTISSAHLKIHICFGKAIRLVVQYFFVEGSVLVCRIVKRVGIGELVSVQTIGVDQQPQSHGLRNQIIILSQSITIPWKPTLQQSAPRQVQGAPRKQHRRPDHSIWPRSKPGRTLKRCFCP